MYWNFGAHLWWRAYRMMEEIFANEERRKVYELADREGNWYPFVKSERGRNLSGCMYHLQPPFTLVPVSPTLENTEHFTVHEEEVVKWREKFLKLPRAQVELLGLEADRSSSDEEENEAVEGEKETDGVRTAGNAAVKNEAQGVTDEVVRDALLALLQEADLSVCSSKNMKELDRDIL